jgi:hypothetical protein
MPAPKTNTRDAAIDALIAEINAAAQMRDASYGDISASSYATYRITAASRALAVLTSPQGE